MLLNTPITAPRVALAVSYDGNAYHGWQIQKKPVVATVQACLEQALSAVAGAPVQVFCAGRTDAGVHASRQIIHFENHIPRSEKAWVMGCNANLPRDISVDWALGVSADFHARFSATARTYRYYIYNRPVRNGLASKQATWIADPIDTDLIYAESRCLLGELDFSSFRGAGCQSNSPFRFVHHIEVARSGDMVVIEIKANAFLLHMVRTIVGVLTAVATGRQPPGWTAQVLAAKDRTQAGVTAPPTGLYLTDVDYPDAFGLPPAASLATLF